MNLLEALRVTRSAMTAYALQVIAAGEANEELAGPARAALRPFDAVREVQARRAAARARKAGAEPTEEFGEGMACRRRLTFFQASTRRSKAHHVVRLELRVKASTTDDCQELHRTREPLS